MTNCGACWPILRCGCAPTSRPDWCTSTVTIQTLALVVALGLAGPLLSWSDRLRIPVLVGELAAGVVMGRTGLRVLDPAEPAFGLLADTAWVPAD